MSVLIDTCVLYPTLLREIVIGAAREGLFEPRWSPRILTEWRHAMARDGEEGRIAVEAQIALLTTWFPKALADAPDALVETLHLPDPDDRHVLAAAISGGCDELLTLNLRDFPTRALAAHAIIRRDPDGFLMELLEAHSDTMIRVVRTAVADALQRKPDRTGRSLLKRARLPRLGKALYP